MRPIAVTRSSLASTLALWRGTKTFRPAARQPEKMLVLYDMENCPFCRLAREALTELDLDVLIRPCPKNGERFRPDVVERGGKAQFPFLVDPNEGVTLYESADIIEHLGRTYDGPVSGTRGLRRSWRVVTSSLASAANASRGMRAHPSKAPDQPLELYSFESSPYCRLVREVLCELEIPYVLRNMGKVSWRELGWPWVRDRLWRAPMATGRNRARLAELTGRVQVPYLVDPNTDTAMFESADIVDYLRSRYGQS